MITSVSNVAANFKICRCYGATWETTQTNNPSVLGSSRKMVAERVDETTMRVTAGMRSRRKCIASSTKNSGTRRCFMNDVPLVSRRPLKGQTAVSRSSLIRWALKLQSEDQQRRMIDGGRFVKLRNEEGGRTSLSLLFVHLITVKRNNYVWIGSKGTVNPI